MTEWKPTETQEQIAVCQYLDLKGYVYNHTPNEGKRSTTTARILKAMGMKKGFPDLMIYEPKGGFHGLAIEMKAENGKLSKDQKKWLQILESKGYFATVCWGADAAIKLINIYMNLK